MPVLSAHEETAFLSTRNNMGATSLFEIIGMIKNIKMKPQLAAA